MSSTLDFRWSDVAITKVTDYLKQGLSAGQIAKHLGCSRNAVIGKAHRLGLHLGAGVSTPSQKKPVPRKVSLPDGHWPKVYTPPPEKNNSRMMADNALRARIKRREAIERGEVAPPKAPVSMRAFLPGYQGQEARVSSVLTLTSGDCKFPIDLDGGGTGFCGDTREEHTSYCKAHALRCFNPNSAAMRNRFS